MSKPDPADVLVAGAADRLALIWMRSDATAALAFCKELHDLRADVVVSLRQDTTPKVARTRHTMPAKFPGRCVICATGFGVGEPIFFDNESRQAVHARCA